MTLDDLDEALRAQFLAGAKRTALARNDAIRSFLKQGIDETSTFADAERALIGLG